MGKREINGLTKPDQWNNLLQLNAHNLEFLACEDSSDSKDSNNNYLQIDDAYIDHILLTSRLYSNIMSNDTYMEITEYYVDLLNTVWLYGYHYRLSLSMRSVANWIYSLGWKWSSVKDCIKVTVD